MEHPVKRGSLYGKIVQGRCVCGGWPVENFIEREKKRGRAGLESSTEVDCWFSTVAF
jgi:hypothetical protein